jgi:hypothetical protein
MNKSQKVILWVGILTIVLLGLFPPTHSQVRQSITNPYTIFELRVDAISYRKLLILWAMVAFVTGGLLVTCKDKKNP